ncbi:polysaccharide biosynthesis tyrosine autokinase [Nocardioides terrisoli]|uniref:polysaccharide biosynthesis tyrosine autokinase n=1 Tax=Nocardioides terrisoli TaxID=3388267 RepID=UPI00287BB829|nr:polysaccharide biosynthesis tyrosine autokinase [Nocardioides marmorisolisilvae]
MELRDYLRIARRRWALIVGTVAVFAILASAYTAQVVPQYASDSTVFVSTTPGTSAEAYQGDLFSQQRVTSYADLMNGLKLAGRVVKDLHLDLTPAQLSSKISANAVPNTVLLDITVTDPSPTQAQLINQAVVNQLQKMVAQIETPPGKRTPLLKATVVDSPRLPSSPVSPKPVRNIGLALVLGLLIGFGIAVLREVLDTTVKDPRALHGLEDVPLLAGLALDSDVHKHPLISGLPPHAARSEAFRVLRTNLQFLDVDSTSKVFVVTSSVPGEGKSTTATNIAIALANAGKSVLLVDGDLRRPQVATMLGLENAVGLTTLLVGDVDLDDALQVHSQSGLRVLTSGAVPPNPAELLQTQAMHDLLANLRARFDIVIMDATPLLPVTDAALLSSLADGALVVVRHSRTTKEQLTGAIDRLGQVDAAVLGLILNMVPRKRGLGGEGYGYGYGYGYAPEEVPKARRRHARRAAATPVEESTADGDLGEHTEVDSLTGAPLSEEGASGLPPSVIDEESNADISAGDDVRDEGSEEPDSDEDSGASASEDSPSPANSPRVSRRHARASFDVLEHEDAADDGSEPDEETAETQESPEAPATSEDSAPTSSTDPGSARRRKRDRKGRRQARRAQTLRQAQGPESEALRQAQGSDAQGPDAQGSEDEEAEGEDTVGYWWRAGG